MNQIDVDGIRLEVRQIPAVSRSGLKSPIVFLHEGLGSVSSWTQRGIDWSGQVCAATGRTGLVYSRQGYGRSDPAVLPLTARYMHHEAWGVLPALLEKLQIPQPVLLGHSDGATIALLHASRFAVSACIAMAPHVTVEEIALKAIQQARVAFESGQLRERLARHHADVDGAFRQWNDVWLSDDFRGFDIRADCQRIKSALLLIQGLDDEYGTLRQLDEIAASVPQARQHRLPGCGHSPHRDQPQGALQAVVDFLLAIP